MVGGGSPCPGAQLLLALRHCAAVLAKRQRDSRRTQQPHPTAPRLHTESAATSMTSAAAHEKSAPTSASTESTRKCEQRPFTWFGSCHIRMHRYTFYEHAQSDCYVSALVAAKPSLYCLLLNRSATSSSTQLTNVSFRQSSE